MSTSHSGSRMVDASITILELHGVKCQPKRGSGLIGGIKRISYKYGDYADVYDNSENIPTEPNIKAVVTYQHPSSDGIINNVEQLTSLPMAEESRDATSLIMCGMWPADGRENNSFTFSREIQQVLITNGANGTKTEMSIPASVSLQVGLMDGSGVIHPLGVATVLVSGNDQSVDLHIPVEIDKKKQKFKPKALFRKEMNATTPKHNFFVTGWTMLKINLNVVAKQINTVPAGSSNEASSTAAVASRDAKLIRFNMLGAHKKSHAASLRSSFKRTQAKAISAFNARKGRSSLVQSETSDGILPELTVLSPFSKAHINQCHDGATEIVLNSLFAENEAAADSDSNTVSKLATISCKSFDATVNDEDSSVTDRTPTVASKSFADFTENSIVSEHNESVTKSIDSKSKNTQDTQSSSVKSSHDEMSEIIITASKVTFEEPEADETPSPQPLPRVTSPTPSDPFSEDVTTQLDKIVRTYSQRLNAEKSDNPETSDKSKEDEGDNSRSRSLTSQEREQTVMADIIVNTLSADTTPPEENQYTPVMDMIQETPKLDTAAPDDATQEIQSVILIHEDASGACFDVEVSVDGDLANVIENESQPHAQSQTDAQTKNDDPNAYELNEGPSPISRMRSATPITNQVTSFDKGYITVKHTMSSVDELTIDSALDTITTAPSVVSKSIKVAKNKRHPQRKEAVDFLRRMTLCGSDYTLAEVMDDAVVGWRDIVVTGCDGFGDLSDDESAESTLNTMDDTLLSNPSLFGGKVCRGV